MRYLCDLADPRFEGAQIARNLHVDGGDVRSHRLSEVRDIDATRSFIDGRTSGRYRRARESPDLSLPDRTYGTGDQHR